MVEERNKERIIDAAHLEIMKYAYNLIYTYIQEINGDFAVLSSNIFTVSFLKFLFNSYSMDTLLK